MKKALGPHCLASPNPSKIIEPKLAQKINFHFPAVFIYILIFALTKNSGA